MENRRIPTEHVEQVTFINEFEKRWPDVRVFAIPNGGYRAKITAEKLKAEGVRKGVPDLFIPAWRLFIEMKRQKGGTLSADQKDWIHYLDGVGYTCIVAKGWVDAFEQISNNLPNLVDGVK